MLLLILCILQLLNVQQNSFATELGDNDFLPFNNDDNLKGYLNREGRFVIQPKFQEASDFYNGRAIVRYNNKIGYINYEGNFIIEPKFEFASNFTEGYAPVKYQGQWGFIDQMGNWVIKPRFDSAFCFFHGIACVSYNYRYGFIDKTGKFVIRPQYTDVHYMTIFKDKYVPVQYGNKSQTTWGYIDKSGKSFLAVMNRHGIL